MMVHQVVLAVQPQCDVEGCPEAGTNTVNVVVTTSGPIGTARVGLRAFMCLGCCERVGGAMQAAQR